jgi:prepilin signal peptidase PulO-like enzyme (type II secretory pathway)
MLEQWLLAIIGLVAGALVNWATYSLAFHRRAISPWSPPDPKAPPRSPLDRIPILGWLGLRREAALHGRGFWIRPLLVELTLAAGLVLLYRWEVLEQGLVAGQFAVLGVGAAVAPKSALLPTFVAHAILVTLMAAASLIDFDEKTIPGPVTDFGTLAGLALAAIAPAVLLPHVALRPNAPVVGVAIATPVPLAGGSQIFLEPCTAVAPNMWPPVLDAWPGLVVGVACFLLWCFALTPRIWRGRRGAMFALRLIAARVARELARPPLAWVLVAGLVAIAAVWARGGAAWIGLLSSLVGVVGASAMVWAVRIVGSAALGREAMGFGDVTLMMMVGAFLGWQAGVVIFFIAPLAGLLVGVAQLVLRRDDEIPYGPFLCLATLAIMLRWADLWHEPPGGLQLLFELGGLVAAALLVCIALLGAVLVAWQAFKTKVLRIGAAQK